MEKIFVDIFTFKHSFCSPEVNMNYNHVYNILRFFDVWADLQKWNEAWLLVKNWSIQFASWVAKQLKT